jgi:tellurite methyltransferase
MAEGDRERWNGKWTDAGAGTSHGSKLVDLLSPWLVSEWLPSSSRLLDIAGGGSTDSIAFAEHGYDVTVCDVSDVGLAVAQQCAAEAGVEIQTACRDLESESLPDGPWDIITIANYLQRDLFAGILESLGPKGLLGVIIATEKNLERNDKPGASFLLSAGELPDLIPGLEILHHTEEWRDNGRYEAHLVACR